MILKVLTATETGDYWRGAEGTKKFLGYFEGKKWFKRCILNNIRDNCNATWRLFDALAFNPAFGGDSSHISRCSSEKVQ